MQKKLPTSAHANHLQAAIGLLNRGGIASRQVLKSNGTLTATLGMETVKVAIELMQSIPMTLTKVTWETTCTQVPLAFNQLLYDMGYQETPMAASVTGLRLIRRYKIKVGFQTQIDNCLERL